MWWEGLKAGQGDVSRGLEGTGSISLQGEHCALAQGGAGGMGQCTEVPTFPAALGTLGIQASRQICPLLLTTSIKHPRPQR